MRFLCVVMLRVALLGSWILDARRGAGGDQLSLREIWYVFIYYLESDRW